MSRTKTAYNPTDGPIVVDDEGHQIAGRDHGRVDPAHPLVASALDAGLLLTVEDRDDTEPHVVSVDTQPPSEAPTPTTATTTGGKP